MKLTKRKLNKLIQEEVNDIINEISKDEEQRLRNGLADYLAGKYMVNKEGDQIVINLDTGASMNKVRKFRLDLKKERKRHDIPDRSGVDNYVLRIFEKDGDVWFRKSLGNTFGLEELESAAESLIDEVVLG